MNVFDFLQQTRTATVCVKETDSVLTCAAQLEGRVIDKQLQAEMVTDQFVHGYSGTHLGSLHTTAKRREAVDFHQSCCKKSRVGLVDPSHWTSNCLHGSTFSPI